LPSCLGWLTQKYSSWKLAQQLMADQTTTYQVCGSAPAFAETSVRAEDASQDIAICGHSKLSTDIKHKPSEYLLGDANDMLANSWVTSDRGLAMHRIISEVAEGLGNIERTTGWLLDFAPHAPCELNASPSSINFDKYSLIKNVSPGLCARMARRLGCVCCCHPHACQQYRRKCGWCCK